MNGGRLEAIWIKRMKRGPMDPATSAELVAGKGIVGNANQGGRRQVTMIQQEVWTDLMHDLKSDLPPWTRRANLMFSGIDLENTQGRILCIGNCRIRIYGETKPCERMEEALSGLREAMFPNWRGGAFGEIIEGGAIEIGDMVSWQSESVLRI